MCIRDRCINNPPINENSKVRMPGQHALLRRQKSLKEGFELSKETMIALKSISEKFDIVL